MLAGRPEGKYMREKEMMLARASRDRRVILTYNFSPEEGKLLRYIAEDLKLEYIGRGPQQYILFQPHPRPEREIIASVEVSSEVGEKYILKLYDLDIFDRDGYILDHLWSKIGRIFNFFGINISEILKAEQVWK
jgi:hypothetical protein